jgi:asparagine synthase (glutamine-hydrolysing)
MPGLVGFTDKQREYHVDMLEKMRMLLKHSDDYMDDELYSNLIVYGSRTHLGIIDQGKQPYVCNNQIVSWMTGELYNQDELKSKYHVPSTNDNELLANCYSVCRSFFFLKDIDGHYASVIYDKKNNEVHLITDRYGFKRLYWGRIGNDLIWSSELKGFIGHSQFRPVIDQQAVQEFFNVGYQLENRTWFESIELVPPGAVLTFDVERTNINIFRYWSWHEILPFSGHIDERAVIEELARLFQQSVLDRANNNERIGITLSGGLDSRAILAAMPDDYKPLHAFTFGKKGCDDIRFASKAAKVKGAVHHIYELNRKQWILPRVGNVWFSDGSFSLLDMHGLEFLEAYKLITDFQMDGLAGDLVLGGSYLRYSHLDRKIDSEIIKNITGAEIDNKYEDTWYMINKTDPYFINNRVRRFTSSYLMATSRKIEVRYPFWSNGLIDFVYSLPDTLRYKSYIYKKMLLYAFPKYYENIPWQKTGYPIRYSGLLGQLASSNKRLINKVRRESQRLGFKYTDTKSYTDYPEWIRTEPGKSFFQKVLSSKNAIYPQFIDEDRVRRYLRKHLERQKHYHIELCLALTFELWLQQVFEGKYRSLPLCYSEIKIRDGEEVKDEATHGVQ